MKASQCWAIMVAVAGFLVSTFVAGCEEQKAKDAKVVTRSLALSNGDNTLWLPQWVEDSPYGGIYSWSTEREVVDVKSVYLPWRKLHTGRNEFDFSELDEELRRAENRGQRIHLSTPAAGFCPRESLSLQEAPPYWVIQEYDLDPVPGYTGNEWVNAGYPVWEKGPLSEYLRFIRKLGERYRDDPRLAYWGLNTLSCGGEFHLAPDVIVNAEYYAGMSPEVMTDYGKSVIDECVRSLGADKCIWPGVCGAFWGPPAKEEIYHLVPESQKEKYEHQPWPYGGIGEKLDYYAMAKGANIRTGGMEGLDYFDFDTRQIGLRRNPDGHITAEGPVINLVRPADRYYPFFGQEEEMYNWPFDYWRLHVLLAVMTRANWIAINLGPAKAAAGKIAVEIDRPQCPKLDSPDVEMRKDYDGKWKYAHTFHPDDYGRMVNWLKKVIGHGPETSPDAWVALRRGYMMCDKNKPIKNIEHYLVQRNVPDGGITRLARKRNYYAKFDEVGCPIGIEECRQLGSYEARATNLASGQRFMFFDVDDRFIKGGSHKVRIYVLYYDDARSRWRIEYDSADGRKYKPTSDWVKGEGTGKWKTARFDIPDARFSNRQRGQMDFRIRNDGDGDVAVRFVRVVKMYRVGDPRGGGGTASEPVPGEDPFGEGQVEPSSSDPVDTEADTQTSEDLQGEAVTDDQTDNLGAQDPAGDDGADADGTGGADCSGEPDCVD